MALPGDGLTWPLPGQVARNERMKRARAYWSGEFGALVEAGNAGRGVTTRPLTTGGPGTTTNPGGWRRATGGTRGRFWGSRSTANETDTRRHLPIAADIATIGAELLFSEPLRIVVDGPTYPNDGPPDANGEPQWKAGDPTPQTRAAQQRLDACLVRINFGAILLAAAESGNALGSSALRVAFDKAGPMQDQPMIVRTPADAVIPEYQWGILTAVSFWSVVAATRGGTVFRLIERHETGGVIRYGLYQGSGTELGKRVPLESRPETASLALTAQVDPVSNLREFVQVLTGPEAVGKRTAVSIPNMLPDPLDENSNVGRSDYRPDTYSLFDDADEAYTGMMDEIDDAKSRLLIADALLERRGQGQGLGWDADQRVFRLNMPPSETATGNLPIDKVQFDLKTQDRIAGLEWIKRQAIESAGYDLATMGDDDSSGTMTATEVRARNRRSLSTRDKKAAWWKQHLSDLLTAFALVDVQQFPSSETVDGVPVKVNAYPVHVEFADAVQPTKGELLADAKAARDARAESTETIVAYTHPDWTAKQVDEEVQRIEAEDQAQQAVDPIALNPGAGGADFAGTGPTLGTTGDTTAADEVQA